MTEAVVHTTQTFLFTDIEGSTRQWEESPGESSAHRSHGGNSVATSVLAAS